jgi:hypothetical protein
MGTTTVSTAKEHKDHSGGKTSNEHSGCLLQGRVDHRDTEAQRRNACGMMNKETQSRRGHRGVPSTINKLLQ